MQLRKFLILSIVIFVVIVLSNTLLGVFIGKPVIHVYHYESSDRNFADFEVPEKGRKLEFVEKVFKEYKNLYGNTDAKLCRTSKKKLLEFCEWWDFLTHPRWECPYIEPSENPNMEWRKKHIE